MKHIKLETITTTINGQQNTTVEALWFYAVLNDTDQTLNSNGQGIRASVRIDNAIRKASEEKDPYLSLTDEDWERLKQAAENPSAGYPLTPARRLQPFIDALLSAASERPKNERQEALAS